MFLKIKFTDTENRLMFARGREWGGVGEIDEGGQKVHTSSYKRNESRGCNIQHGDYS